MTHEKVIFAHIYMVSGTGNQMNCCLRWTIYFLELILVDEGEHLLLSWL